MVVYGFQHYISMVGSIILIPLVMVPAMGGSAVSSGIEFVVSRALSLIYWVCYLRGYIWSCLGQDDMAAVLSTVLLVTGMTTLLHMFVGTRLPLVQGPSFVYLAPALAIINSPEFFGLNDNVCINFGVSYVVACLEHGKCCSRAMLACLFSTSSPD
jgi:nucleobase transporter 1/2